MSAPPSTPAAWPSPALTRAQDYRGKVQGSITDPSRAAIADAGVTLKNVGTGVAVTRETIVHFSLALADTTKGTRPSFSGAALPEDAEPLYERFSDELESLGVPVRRGIFGAKMEVELAIARAVLIDPIKIVVDGTEFLRLWLVAVGGTGPA
jgi:hypothetical protein